MRGENYNGEELDNVLDLDERRETRRRDDEAPGLFEPRTSRYLPSLFLSPSVERDATIRVLDPVLAVDRRRNEPAMWSDETPWHSVARTRGEFTPTSLSPGWPHEWTFAMKYGKKIEVETVAQVRAVDILAADPIRRPLFYPGKTSRAGTRHVSSTGRHHSHDSLFERDMLLLLDWGQAESILSQPGTLSYRFGPHMRTHTPDFAAVIDGAFTLINCRPAHRVDEALLEQDAAIREVCMSRGWRAFLITGYEEQAMSTLKAVSAKRNSHDWLGYREAILNLLETEPAAQGWTFERVCDSFEEPMEARSMLQRLIWERLVAVDLAVLLSDDSLVRMAGPGVAS